MSPVAPVFKTVQRPTTTGNATRPNGRNLPKFQGLSQGQAEFNRIQTLAGTMDFKNWGQSESARDIHFKDFEKNLSQL